METIHDPTLSPMITWPPNYTLRQSGRAKRISVLISPKNGLVLVVPKRKRSLLPSALDAVIEEHRGWIEKHLGLWMKEQAKKSQEPLFPKRLYFPAFQKEICIEYHHKVSTQIRMTRQQVSHHDLHLEFSSPVDSYINSHLETHFETHRELIILKGPLDDPSKVISVLKKILRLEAERLLLPLLHQLSNNTGLFYHQAIIRSQSSLWGSCTASKKISLNAKLLFLPRSLVEYVLLHELCHTKELNHSNRFWSLLKKFDPHCIQHRKALRSVSQFLPSFVNE